MATKLATVKTDLGAELVLESDENGELSWRLEGYPRSKVKQANEQRDEANRWTRWGELPEDAQGASSAEADLASFVATRLGGTWETHPQPLPERLRGGGDGGTDLVVNEARLDALNWLSWEWEKLQEQRDLEDLRDSGRRTEEEQAALDDLRRMEDEELASRRSGLDDASFVD